MKIQLFIHLIDGNLETLNISNTISIKNLVKKIRKKYKYKFDITLNNNIKFLKYNSTLIENNIKNNDNIYIYRPINGGFIDLLIKLLTGMFDLLKNLGMLIEELISIIIKLLEIIPNVLNPDKLLNDVIFGVTQGITSLLTGIMNQFTFNETSTNNGGLFGIEVNSKKVCIKPTLINLIVLVLCPPLALYIDRGIKGIFLVIVCGLLTYYLYYFPGFLFAALHILC